MAEPRDLYKVLQVDPEADPEVIQAAFRRLAQKFHPDVAAGPDGVARMTAINAAWETLRDPARRAAYDLERARPIRSASEIVRGSAAPSPRPEVNTTDTGHIRRAATAGGVDPSGPSPGDPAAGVLAFGRYAGWSLGEIARHDLEYIEWLDRTPVGRPYRDEIDGILRRAGRRPSTDAEASQRRGLFRRR